MILQQRSFEQALEDNLALYTELPDTSNHNLFQTHREISVARYALSKQAEAYAKAIEILMDVIDNSVNQSSNPKALTDIMMAINAIESKSRSLIQSVQQVTQLLGQAVNIDVDKANLSALILRLPSLVRDSISHVSNDPQLADRISSTLDSRISEMMIACRFTTASSPLEQQQSPAITLDQYSSMINSIPTQPTHVQPQGASS